VLCVVALFDHLRPRPGLPEVLCGIDPSSDQADANLGWLDIGNFTRFGDDTILALAELFKASLVGRDASVGIGDVVLSVGFGPVLEYR
jgi:hypothetical protein